MMETDDHASVYSGFSNQELPLNKTEAEQAVVEAEEQCTCGLYVDPDRGTTQAAQPPTKMDTSFVHLPALLFWNQHHDPRNHPNNHFGNSKTTTSTTTTNNFLHAHQHLEQLLRAAETGGDGVVLCPDCIQRVERALDADSERLENECLMYEQATRQEEERLERVQSALKAAAAAAGRTLNDQEDGQVVVAQEPEDLQARAEQAFLDEIEALEEECRRQEAELYHLKALKKEQQDIEEELIQAECLLEEERNSLELEARAFDSDQEQLHRELSEIQEEVDKLSSVDINLPSLLYDLQVDKERGLRYPLINELRLAYRPKGDIKWNEIQVAWSLAAQLLLVVGTLFHYPSEQWKIVPLSHCAKLIYFCDDTTSTTEGDSGRRKKAIVYHLGHPKTNGSKALRAWNTLLHQVAIHVNHKQDDALQRGEMTISFLKLPFPMTANTVGTIDLAQLNENDDAGWSRAIHFMASNLQWLSECAALYTSQQVVWMSAALQACKV